MRVPSIALASAVSAVLVGSFLSLGGEVSAQTSTITATSTVSSTATSTSTASATASATGTATSGSSPAATATTVMQPVTVSIPTSVFSTPGTLTAIVNGQLCGTVTITGTSTASFAVPASCAIPGQAISFRTASGITLPQTVTIPSNGGALVLGSSSTQATPGATNPSPPPSGNAGLLSNGSAKTTAAMLGLVTLIAIGATALTRRYVRS